MPSQLNGAADSPTGLVSGATAVEMTAPVSNKALAAVTAAGSDSASDKGSGGKADDPEHAVLPADKQTFTKPVSYFSLYKFADRVDWLCVLLGSGGAAVNGAAMPLFALIFGGLVNSFANTSTATLVDQVTQYSLYFVYLGIGTFFAAYLQVALWTLTGVRQVNRMRHKYLASVLRQDVGYFDTTATSGRLLQGLNEDCQAIQLALGDKVGNVIYNLTTAVVGVIIAFIKGWDMTLVMLAVMPFLAGMGFMISVFMSRNASKINTAYADANSIAQQALGNIRTVYAFNGAERTLEAYSASLDPPLKTGIRQGFLGGLVVGITNGVAFFAYSLALWYGGTRVEAGAYNGGDVVAVLFSALIGGFALGQAAPNAQYFQQAKSAGGRIFEIMKRTPEIDLDAQGEILKPMAGTIQFSDVTFAYPSRPDVKVFQHFDLTAPAGKTVALVGESGSGKSTVVGLVMRFYDPLAGAVQVDGVDVRRLQLRFLRSQLGLVSQEPTLFATTIAHNIRFGKPDCTDEEIEAAAKASNAHNFIMGLPKGYATHVGEKGVQMSGGQKQRIAIARAILKDPKILLLDEATSALDAESERVVQDALDKLMVGRTTVVVAHRLSTVINADSIAVVKQGQVVEQGRHEDLMLAKGAYWTLVHTQQHGGGMEESDVRPAEDEDGSDSDGVPDLPHRLSNVLEESPSYPTSITPRKSGDASNKSGGFFRRAATVIPEALTEGAAATDVSQGVARGSVPTGQGLQRGVSGVRRFISFRRKAAKQQEGEKEAGEEDLVDHRKSTAEEEQTKVPLSRIMSLNRPELPAAITGVLGSTGLGLMMPAFSIAFSSILAVFNGPVDEVSAGARKWSLVFVGIGVGAIISALFQSYSFNYMGQKLAQRVRVLMLGALLRQEVGWYDEDRNSSGVLTSKLSADALSVKGQFGDTMGMLTQNMVTLIAGLIVAFVNGWKLSLVVVACLPVMGIGAYYQAKIQIGSASKEDETFARANQTASEAFTNIKTIAAFGMEGQVAALYAEKLEEPTREAGRRSNTGGIGFGFGQFALFSTYALAFWYGGQLVSKGENSFKEVMLVFFSIFLAAMGMAQAQLYFPDVAKGKAASQRVFSIIDRVPAIDAASQAGLQPLSVHGDVELRDVTFAYPQRPEVKVFRHFNLMVSAGKTVALVGESGSGKSTVVGLIERFYDPLAGAVLLDGRDIRELNLRWLREQIGLVGQEPVLFNMTVSENIRYGRPDASDEQVEAAARAANAHVFISKLPEMYCTKLGEGGVTLSGGQKQRVAIARAIVKDPRVLLLDEATSALDSESESVVQEALDRLMVGRTTVVVAHRLSTVRDADVIAVVSRGKILEQGSHDALMASANSAYARLVRHQMSRGGHTASLRPDRARGQAGKL